ncbi:MAG: hypothetical protein AMXMBFR59_20810 [Rhodanobacteraceae bacterium]
MAAAAQFSIPLNLIELIANTEAGTRLDIADVRQIGWYPARRLRAGRLTALPASPAIACRNQIRRTYGNGHGRSEWALRPPRSGLPDSGSAPTGWVAGVTHRRNENKNEED